MWGSVLRCEGRCGEVLGEVWGSVLGCGEVKNDVGKCGGGMGNFSRTYPTFLHTSHLPHTSPPSPILSSTHSTLFHIKRMQRTLPKSNKKALFAVLCFWRENSVTSISNGFIATTRVGLQMLYHAFGRRIP